MTGPRLRPHRTALASVAAAALLAVEACGTAEPPRLVDLAAGGPDTVVDTEATEIDIGTEGARSHLGSGWYYDERRRVDAESFVWSRGATSELRFDLGWRRDLPVELVGRPFHYPGAPPQEIALALNGRPLDSMLRFEGSAERTLRVELPAELQRVGENVLVLRYGRVDAPATVTPGATDERELAVAWSKVRFPTVDPTEPELGDRRLVLPAGGRLDRFVELVGATRLASDACRTRGEPVLVFDVQLLGDDDPEADMRTVVCDGSAVDQDFGSRDGLTRLRLTVHPMNGRPAAAGIELVAPRLETGAAASDRRTGGPTPVAALDPRPNVVIYLVDALRADRLGVYGCQRPLSPRLDAMAAQGIVFTDAVAQSSWTKAAVASIFTGLWPRAHGVNGPDDRLPDELATLPELLHTAGYDTAAVVANAYVGRPFGFARGFDHFEFIDHERGRSEVLHERVAAWLDARRSDPSPFLLYVHTIDPHAPYAPPPDLRRTFAPDVEDPSVGQVETVRGLVLGTVRATDGLERDLRALYDAEVAANDRSLGLLLDELDRLGELDDTVVIFTSDHGEAFGEHGTWTHGLDLYREVLSVPLVIRLPRAIGAGQRVGATVQHIDLLPTILGLTGTTAPAGRELAGRCLLDGSGSFRPPGNRPVMSYLDYWGRTGAAVIDGRWKLIRPLSAEFGFSDELYDRADDPNEHVELGPSRPVRSGWLGARLGAALEVRAAGEATEVDDVTRRQLEALGYMR
ncbi:MAG: sulfatase [Holophagae bacterium]|jgi:arylsulfatase A-like enzyme